MKRRKVGKSEKAVQNFRLDDGIVYCEKFQYSLVITFYLQQQHHHPFNAHTTFSSYKHQQHTSSIISHNTFSSSTTHIYICLVLNISTYYYNSNKKCTPNISHTHPFNSMPPPHNKHQQHIHQKHITNMPMPPLLINTDDNNKHTSKTSHTHSFNARAFFASCQRSFKCFKLSKKSSKLNYYSPVLC